MTHGGSSSGVRTAAKHISNNLASSSSPPAKEAHSTGTKGKEGEKGLFSCEEKYTAGHKYKNKKIFKLEIVLEDGDEKNKKKYSN